MGVAWLLLGISVAVVIVMLLLVHADGRRDAHGLSILEVDGPDGLVPEVTRKRSPVVVREWGGDAGDIARRLRMFPRVTRHVLPAGAARLITCDYGIVVADAGGAEVGVVHPAHRRLLEARAAAEQGGVRTIEGFGTAQCAYVAVRLPPGGCLVVPRNWAVALEYDPCELLCVSGPLPKWV